MAWRDWPKEISWLPKKPREKEFEHTGHNFQSTNRRPNTFSIHPDWVSEENKKPNPFGPRRYRPWSYEFQGARTWPIGTGEVQMLEERTPGATCTSTCTQSMNRTKSPTDAKQWIESSSNRLYLKVVDTKRPFWRPNGKPWSSSYQTPFPTYVTQLPALMPSDRPEEDEEQVQQHGSGRPRRPHTSIGTGEVDWPVWAQGCTPGELTFRIGCLDQPGYTSGSSGRDYLNLTNAQWI